VDETLKPQIDDRQFGGISGTYTTDALVEMMHIWYEATDELGTCVKILHLDYSKAFDHINHEILISKLEEMLVRWMSGFLLDRDQRVGDTLIVVCPREHSLDQKDSMT
jgi:hypothetical protein